ncbi:MAG: hypothetical protein J5981_06840, partial [Lachnospira sp.]|nr:hypothetical protein [Lachnospira sp.]
MRKKRRLKALFLTIILCAAAVSCHLSWLQPQAVYADTGKTGTVNAGVTGLRIRTSTDTSSTANVITKVSGGFHFNILDTVYTSDTYAWYHVGFYLNGTYMEGYVTS